MPILVGTASWTDKSLIDSGKFYPPTAKDTASRLKYYASQFSMVEVDSSYYAMPAAATAQLWAVQVHAGETDEETGRNIAITVTAPEVAEARVIQSAEGASGFGKHIDVPSLTAHLHGLAEAVKGGSMAPVETMLISQATALQSLFARLVERAMRNDTIAPFEANMRLALRAQSQCRATLETLAAIKNPPIVFAQQANIASGPQQVNNGVANPLHARESEIEQSKLLKADHGKRLDTRAQGAAEPVDPEMATVGTINRAEDGKR
jgi:hypothetical protein